MRNAAALIAIVMALSLSPAAASAAEEPPGAACPSGEFGVTITYTDPYGIFFIDVPVCVKPPPPTN